MQATYEIIREEVPGLVWVRIIGEPSIVDSEKLVVEAVNFIRQHDGLARFLVDARQAGLPESAAGNLAYLHMLNNFSGVRAAVYGASPTLERTIRLVLQIARVSDRIALFPDEAAARQWLQDH